MSSSISFLSSISSFPSSLKTRLRRLKSGIFISENIVSEIEASYKEWLRNNNILLKADEVISKRIFGSDKLSLSYLPEGQDCFTGYLVLIDDKSLTEEQLKELLADVPLSASSVISAKSFLHPKDQSFNQSSDIKIRRSPTEGTFIEFKIKERKYTVKESLLRELAELLRSSKRFSEEFPLLDHSLRDAIFVISTLIKKSSPVSKGRHLFIPESALKDNIFHIFKNLIIVFNADYQLIEFYELRGKNFKKKVLSELELLKGGAKSRTFDVVDICSSKTSFYLRTKVKGKFLSIDTYAFIELVDMASQSKWLSTKLPNRFTVKDLILAISSALKYADWINMAKLNSDSNSADNSSAKNVKSNFELKYIPWTFEVGRNNTITKFIEGGGATNFRKPPKQFKKNKMPKQGNQPK